jgi:hypothetical protein
MIERLFPRQIDNRFEGRRLALWLLGALIALRLLMSINSILNTESVASGADGFRLASYGADGANAVLMLFALVAMGQLTVTLVGITALVRYRAMVPLVFLLLLADHVARRLIVQAYAIERSAKVPIGSAINIGIAAVLLVGLALSLSRPRSMSGSDAEVS